MTPPDAPGRPTPRAGRRRGQHRAHRTRRPRHPLAAWAAAVVLGLGAGGAAAWGATGGSPAAASARLGHVLGRTAPEPLPQAAAVGGLIDRRAASASRAERPAEPSGTPVPLDIAVPTVQALPPGLTADDVAAGLLSADVPESAAGTFTIVPGGDPGPGTGTVRTVRVEVEDGLAVDGAAFAATVMATLNDPRGWGHDGSLSFARTDGAAELRVLLASPATVDALCAPLDTAGEVSCGRAGHAVLNLRRWVLATQELQADKVGYRQYLVNHEVGHLLGHGHEQCPAPGAVAPVMQQQSYKAAPCVPNAWPFP